ncbi:MAG: HlyD family efflux transporter periplasmic adaptor subunit [Ramlibacter sp.]|nr:HlyD family efflux transporter periplasmic adaptor subunit [Ramlibacter sp.]
MADAAVALAAELADLLDCRRVTVGLRDGNSVRIVANSLGRDIDGAHDAAALLAAAMNESLDQAATVRVPPAPDTIPQVNYAHLQLALQGAACTVPLRAAVDEDGAPVLAGALTLERDTALTAAEQLLCEDVASFAGPILSLLEQASLPVWRRALRAIRQWVTAPGKRVARVTAGGLAVMLALSCTVPLPYRVSAPARLEGAVQRAIAASTDGYLQQANVRAGDVVKAGQVLAELASQDLLLERRRRESELAQHENAYRAALAHNDRAQMVISQSRAGEAQALLALTDSQIERARIVAPFDGIVIKGDLSQTLGAPVQRGEVLLTLAPNDSFRLIVEVDEADISTVRPGQHGELALAAVSDRALGFTTRRIVPVATSSEARNYFEVEAVLDPLASGSAPSLRPGLSGVARIHAGERSLAWIVTRRALNWLRLTLWSLGL